MIADAVGTTLTRRKVIQARNSAVASKILAVCKRLHLPLRTVPIADRYPLLQQAQHSV